MLRSEAVRVVGECDEQAERALGIAQRPRHDSTLRIEWRYRLEERIPPPRFSPANGPLPAPGEQRLEAL
ncbi:MAG: hypothetical protein ACREU4_06705, partial [Burkholderiales bacterium]